MDFEQIQRIDLLSKQLKENGLACTYQEAAEKARTMILRADTAKHDDGPMEEKIQILEQRYRYMINTITQKYNADIEQLNKKLAAVDAEIMEFKRKLVQIEQSASRPRQDVQHTLFGSQAKPHESAMPLQASQNQPIAPTMAKAGDKELNPQEFSVEKYFYFGNR